MSPQCGGTQSLEGGPETGQGIDDGPRLPDTVSREVFSIEFFHLWDGLIPQCLEVSRTLTLGHIGNEVTGLDHSHLHSEVGELPSVDRTRGKELRGRASRA